MAWQIEWEVRASRELLKLDKQIQRDIVRYFDEKIAPSTDPRALGKPLKGNLAGFWRYRLGDHIENCRSLVMVNFHKNTRISEIVSARVDLFVIDTLVKYLSILGKRVSVNVEDKDVA